MKRTSRIRHVMFAFFLVVALSIPMPAQAHTLNPHHTCPTLHSIKADSTYYGHSASKVSSIWWPAAQWDNIYNHYVWEWGRWNYTGHYTRVTCW